MASGKGNSLYKDERDAVLAIIGVDMFDNDKDMES